MNRAIEVRSREVEPMALEKAILVYGGGKKVVYPGGILSERGRERELAYATVHDIYLGPDGRASLLPGVPATVDAVAELVGRLGQGLALDGYLPETVLHLGVGALVWWCKPCQRQVWFEERSGKIGSRTGSVPHPGLIFAVSACRWDVFAIKGADRPVPETPLYRAPYFNVWINGEICVGNVRMPESGAAVSAIREWENAFFGSNFTHPNDVGVRDKKKVDLVRYKGGCFTYWKDMLDKKFEAFPEKVLVQQENPPTLESLIHRIQSGTRRRGGGE